MSWNQANSKEPNDPRHEDQSESALSVLARMVLQPQKDRTRWPFEAHTSSQTVTRTMHSSSTKTVREIQITRIGGVEMISKMEETSRMSQDGFRNVDHAERVLDIHVEKESESEVRETPIHSKYSLAVQESTPKLQKHEELSKINEENKIQHSKGPFLHEPLLKMKEAPQTTAAIPEVLFEIDSAIKKVSQPAGKLKIKEIPKPSILLEELERIRSMSVQALPNVPNADTNKEKVDIPTEEKPIPLEEVKGSSFKELVKTFSDYCDG